MSTRPDFFSHPELGLVRRMALEGICLEWEGTPFRQRSSVKGKRGGVDCAGFVAAAFLELGAVEEAIAVPPYEVNRAEHNDESMFRAWFERPEVRGRVRPIDQDEPHVAGDLVFPVVGRCEHHIAIRIGQIVWHVARPSGVCGMTVSQFKFHRSRYRLLEP